MLYVTTRNKHDTYTVHHVLEKDRGEDGGLFQPFHLVPFTRDELFEMAGQTFGQRVAQILNLFFSARLTGWDVDFCAGKNPVKIVPMSHRILEAECWHNPDNTFARMEKALCERICGKAVEKPTAWMAIGVRIAVLFGIYGDLLASETVRPDKPLDVAVAAGDFTAPMAVWFAREMGLPIGNVICCCDEDSGLWELLHHGEVRTDCGMPVNLERLIHLTLGVEEAVRYCEICAAGRTYATRPGMLEQLRKGMDAYVVSAQRQSALIPSVYRTGGIILAPESAQAYGGLLDYRAKTGESRHALLLAERSPVPDKAAVAAAMDISEQELLRQLGE